MLQGKREGSCGTVCGILIIEHFVIYQSLWISQGQECLYDQLLVTYTDIANSVDRGLGVNVIFLDFCKTFDAISHVTILEK